MEKLKGECEKLKQQVQSMKEDKLTKDGEIHILRDTLSKKDSELQKYKLDSSQQVESHEKERVKFEKESKKELERLKMELQFKNQEIQEATGLVKRLEQRYQNCESPSQSMSSQVVKLAKPSKTVRNSNDFPTAHSFLQSTRTVQPETNSLGVQCDDVTGVTNKPLKSRKYCLNISSTRTHGNVQGPSLVGCLLARATSDGSLLGTSVYEGTSDVKRCNQGPKTPDRLVPSNQREVLHQVIHKLLSSTPSSSTVTPELYQCNTQSAVLLVPLIRDSIYNYLEFGQDSIRDIASKATSQDFTPPGSPRDNSAVTNICLDGLRALYQIVIYCPAVREMILNEKSKPKKKQETDNKVLDADATLLALMFQLVKPDLQDDTMQAMSVIEMCLKCLTKLAESASSVQLERFMDLLNQNALQDCLCLYKIPSILCLTLDLIQPLCLSSKLVACFCSHTELCLLLCMYRSCILCCRKAPEDSHRETVISKIINVLWSIITYHKGGSVHLIETDCECSHELIKTVVKLLYRELSFYRETKSVTSANTLRQGLALIQGISLHDPQFLEHCGQVEHPCVMVISGVVNILKDLPDVPDAELLALHEIWDMDDQESQESTPEDEQPMEVETTSN